MHTFILYRHCAEDFMSISSQIERIKGHTLGEPEKAFIVTESERDPKEVKQRSMQDIFIQGGDIACNSNMHAYMHAVS